MKMTFLAAFLSSSILVACGGGGSGAPASLTPGSLTPGSSTPGPSTTGPLPPVASPAIEALAKYEGVWQEDCVDHKRLTKTFKATGSNTFSVTTKEEYFNDANCNGALFSTGSYDIPDENVRYEETVTNAFVTLQLDEPPIRADVDPGWSVAATGATFTIIIGDVKVKSDRPALNGQTNYGALLLRNDELLALVPIAGSTNEFKVNHRYSRQP